MKRFLSLKHALLAAFALVAGNVWADGSATETIDFTQEYTYTYATLDGSEAGMTVPEVGNSSNPMDAGAAYAFQWVQFSFSEAPKLFNNSTKGIFLRMQGQSELIISLPDETGKGFKITKVVFSGVHAYADNDQLTASRGEFTYSEMGESSSTCTWESGDDSDIEEEDGARSVTFTADSYIDFYSIAVTYERVDYSYSDYEVKNYWTYNDEEVTEFELKYSEWESRYYDSDWVQSNYIEQKDELTASGAKVSYSSSNPSVVYVEPEGLYYTVLGVGEAVITVRTSFYEDDHNWNFNASVASCKFIITEDEVEVVREYVANPIDYAIPGRSYIIVAQIPFNATNAVYDGYAACAYKDGVIPCTDINSTDSKVKLWWEDYTYESESFGSETKGQWPRANSSDETAIFKLNRVNEDEHYYITTYDGKYLIIKDGKLVTTSDFSEAADNLWFINTYSAGSAIFSTADGKYQLFYDKDNGYISVCDAGYGPSPGDDEQNRTLYSLYLYKLIETEDTTLTVGELGYASFYLPYSIIVPEDDLMYYVGNTYGEDAQVNENVLTLRSVPSGSLINALTPFIMKGTQGETKEFKAEISDEPWNGYVYEEYLQGTCIGDTVKADDGELVYGLNYIMDGETKVVGFYWFPGSKGKWCVVPRNRACLKLAEGVVSDARGLTFRFGESETTTAIDELSTVNRQPSTVYDLQGRKLSKVQRGVNIVDGRKVIR